MILWGTGKPLRQFMYGGDFARIIKYIIDKTLVFMIIIIEKSL